jgi:pimeloyl-ACP methyl ester carboxylesterase
LEDQAIPKAKIILYHASALDLKLSGRFALAVHYQDRRPQAKPVEKRHLRTCPWSGHAAVMSVSAAVASCLPLRGSVRRTRALYYDHLKQRRLMVMNLHRIYVKALPALVSSTICIPILYNNHSARASYEIHSISTWADSRMIFRERSHQPAVTTGGHEHIDSLTYLAQSQIPSTSTHLIIFFGGAGDSTVSETVKTLASAIQKRYRSSGLGSEKVLIKYFPWDEEAASTNAVMEHLKGFPNSSIILVGHSYGGDTAFTVADKLEKDIRIKLLVTLDPVGHYYGNNNNLDCRPDYPSSSGRKSKEERQCELQRSQRKKPASTDKWINVWAKGASTFSDLVSTAGGRWNGQANADQDIPMDLAHGEASRMYSKADSSVLAILNSYGDSEKSIPSCNATIDSVKAELTRKGFFVPYKVVHLGKVIRPGIRVDKSQIRKYWFDYPEDRTESVVFSLGEVGGLWTSPKYMATLASKIINSCRSVGIVDFSWIHEGSAIYGFFPDGGVKEFKPPTQDGNYRQVATPEGNVGQWRWGIYVGP